MTAVGNATSKAEGSAAQIYQSSDLALASSPSKTADSPSNGVSINSSSKANKSDDFSDMASQFWLSHAQKSATKVYEIA